MKILTNFRTILSSFRRIFNNISDIYIKFDNRNIKGTKIINCEYFIDKIILFSNLGEIVAVNTAGYGAIIWNDDIAKAVNYEESAKGWSNTTSVCFAVFNGK